VEAPTVTGRIYAQLKRLDEKRAALNGIDAAQREIIGPRPQKLPRSAYAGHRPETHGMTASLCAVCFVGHRTDSRTFAGLRSAAPSNPA
jgi:hypothetical protein